MRLTQATTALMGEAVGRTELRGHELGDWSLISRDPGGLYFYEGLEVAMVAFCMRCGMEAMVNAKPVPRDIPMWGAALFSLCDGRYRLDSAPGFGQVLSRYHASPFVLYAGGVRTASDAQRQVERAARAIRRAAYDERVAGQERFALWDARCDLSQAGLACALVACGNLRSLKMALDIAEAHGLRVTTRTHGDLQASGRPDSSQAE